MAESQESERNGENGKIKVEVSFIFEKFSIKLQDVDIR
jgi:hypothetical protein